MNETRFTKQMFVENLKVFIVLAIVFLLGYSASFGAVGDTLAIRAFYVENYSYGSLDGDIGSGFSMPPSNFAWRTNKTTHTIMFGGSGNAGMFSQTSPYWGPVVNSSDSASLISGNTGQPYWRWWRDSTHANGGYLIQSFNAVNSSDFDFVCADSTRSYVFWNAFYLWAIRNDVDGGDLDAENSTQSSANRTRFFRIGRRIGYNSNYAAYISALGKTGFRRSGKAIIGNALFMLSTNWMSSSADSTVDFFDLQAYNYHNMWGGSGNRPWYQTPWGVPAGQACGTCEAQGLSYGYTSHKNLIQEWVDAGWSRQKIVVGFDPSAVTTYTGTNAFGTGTPTGTVSDVARQDFVDMTQAAYGGARTYNATAMAPYIAGTVSVVNPAHVGDTWNGSIYTHTGGNTQYVGSYTDSVSIKAICDSLYKVGAGGIMIYAVAKDIATLGSGSNHALDYYRTPTISAGSYRAWQLQTATGGAPPTVVPPSIILTSVTPTSDGASVVGNVTSAGGGTLSAISVLYSASSIRTGSETILSVTPLQTGSFTKAITGLSVGATRFVWVSASNEVGTTYNPSGGGTSFTVSGVTATTVSVSTTQKTATLNGSVASFGGVTIDERGFVYMTGAGTPTVSNTKVQVENGVGSFSMTVTGLPGSTLMSWRTYGHSVSGGYVYGSVIQKATADCPVTGVDMIVLEVVNP